jgi:hypothetical protein
VRLLEKLVRSRARELYVKGTRGDDMIDPCRSEHAMCLK